MSQSKVSYTGKMKQKATYFKYSSKNKNFSKTSQTIAKGSEVSIDMTDSSGYYRIDKDGTNKVNLWVSDKTVKLDNADIIKNLNKEQEKIIDALKKDLSKTGYKNVNVDKLLIHNLTGIMGVPYQFMTTCDNPVTNNVVFGRKYIERIVLRMPLLLITPGEPDFLPSFSKKQKQSVLKALIDQWKGEEKDVSSFLNGKSGRYYTFKFNEKEYWKYVNSMLRYCAIALGIDEVKHKVQQINYHGNKAGIEDGEGFDKSKKGYEASFGSFKWQKAVNPSFRKYTNGTQSAIAFYLDSETSISENLSNSTTTSGLASSINGVADTAREFRFLAGPIAGIVTEPKQNGIFKKSYDKIMSTSRKFLSPLSNKLFDNLDEMFKAIGKGGKLAFPEIWEDSDFSRSYDVSLKLRTPDGDKISWYLNICVPLIHILALAAPRSLSPNAYKSPFLLRGYYKGIFSIDMGIITGVSITKGKEGAWTLDGLPTEVDVQISLKDLYSMFSISKVGTSGVKDFILSKGVKKFLKNTCLVDYLANMCGININSPEVSRLMKTYIQFRKNQFADINSDLYLTIDNAISNKILTIYDKFKW